MSAAASRASVLLLSSDARRRYAEDVLTALALPEGAAIQFRYEAAYVAPGLQQRVATGTIIGARALICFVSGVTSAEPFLVPVRWATVASARNVADVYVFTLAVHEYPDIDDYPLPRAQIHTTAATTISKLVEVNGNYYPATGKFPDLHVTSQAEHRQNWIGVARRLAQHPTFHDAYFMCVENPVRQSGSRPWSFDADGRLRLIGGRSVKIPVSFYSEVYNENTKNTLTCDTDGGILRISSDTQYDVALRYDSVEFWLHPNTPYDALSHVTLRLGQVPESGPSKTIAAAASFPVVVRRSRSQLIARTVLSASGAVLVALPAVLGQGSSLRLRIVLALVGAAFLAYSTVVMSTGTTQRGS